MSDATRVHHQRPAGESLDDVLVMCGDAVREWARSRAAKTLAGRRDHEEAALVNTFQALSQALRLSGMPEDLAASLFRRFVEASGALR